MTAYDFREYNPFRFSSEYADGVLELIYYNYRHYYPKQGFWLSREPLREEMSFYLYVKTLKGSKKDIEDINLLSFYGSDYLFINNRALLEFDTVGMLPHGSYPEWGGDNPWPPYNEIPTKGNCWRYACNDPAKGNELPKINPPGTDLLDLNCESIINGVISVSGAKTIAGDSGECEKCHYKVLLVIFPGIDYHWYRQDDDGKWSHKRGDHSIELDVGDPVSDGYN